MRSHVSTLTFLVACLIGGSACGSASDPGATTTATTFDGIIDYDPLITLDGTSWLAESFITVGPLQPIVANPAVTLNFDVVDHLLVTTGCNSGSADVTYGPDRTATIGAITLTKIGCEPDAAALEQRIVTFLAEPLLWDVVDGKLKLLPTNVTDSGMILSAA
jgi:heat shock protein HslJ